MVANLVLLDIYFLTHARKPRASFFVGILMICFSIGGTFSLINDIFMYISGDERISRDFLGVGLAWVAILLFMFAICRICLIDKWFAKVIRPKVDIVGFCLITAVSLALLLCFIFAVILLFLR